MARSQNTQIVFMLCFYLAHVVPLAFVQRWKLGAVFLLEPTLKTTDTAIVRS